MDFPPEIIGVIAAILTTSGFVPQVVKTFKSKSVEGISLSMFSVLFAGTIFWLVYGILIRSFSIILANIFSSIFILALIVMRIMYKK